jgi:predicted transcriptional regulator
MRKLFFKIRVDKGLEELDQGKGISHEEVERKLSG